MLWKLVHALRSKRIIVLIMVTIEAKEGLRMAAEVVNGLDGRGRHKTC
ncbi:hypothetical protein ACP70R_048557 [Stipagrostis hirtigluma subsp. patula]